MIFESRYCQCSSVVESVKPIYRRVTQFAGIHYFCASCALLEPDFGVDDPSYQYWEIITEKGWVELSLAATPKEENWINPNQSFRDAYKEYKKIKNSELKKRIDYCCKSIYENLIERISTYGNVYFIIHGTYFTNNKKHDVFFSDLKNPLVWDGVIKWCSKSDILYSRRDVDSFSEFTFKWDGPREGDKNG